MSESYTLRQLTEEIVQDFRNYDATGTNSWTYATAIRDLPYQLGSLTKLLNQLEGDRFADGQTPDQIKAKMADELADIMAEVLFAAHELGIDMDQAWRDMIKSDETKISERSTPQ